MVNGLLIIGGSTGAIDALEIILPKIPSDFPFGILIIQHLLKQFENSFVQSLKGYSSMDVIIAQEKMEINQGIIYVAPSEMQTSLSNHIFHIFDEESIFAFKPCLDIAFSTSSYTYKSKTVGVILSGMSVECDGVIGSWAIKNRGGSTYAQDEASSKVFGMAKKCIDSGYIDFVLPPDKIISNIIEKVM